MAYNPLCGFAVEVERQAPNNISHFYGIFPGKRIAWLVPHMPSTDIYARCNFTRSGQPNIRFDVVIKVPKAKLEELRRLPANSDQTDNQLLGKLAGKVVTILCPEPGAAFAIGCERHYPESVIPSEIKERPEGTKIDELIFWSI